MNICVHTSSSRRGEVEPHVFFIGGHRLIVAGIRSRWVEHPCRYYEVTCDDGRGFPLGRAGRIDSYGMVGMRERADAIGAHLEFDSTQGRGTTVRCRLTP